MNRDIVFEGISNARDMGGLKTKDGKTIRSHALIRSAKLSSANHRDELKLRDEYHLKKIIDLRTATERLEKPDAYIDGAKYLHLPVFKSATAGITHEEEVKMLEDAGYAVVYTAVLPDELEQIKDELVLCADEKKISLVMTTGGTGFSPRDVTPEATLSVIERETRGIPEAMRYASLQITPRGCLSRSVAGIRGKTLIVNLPGSEKAAKENLAAVLDAIGHGLEMLACDGSTDQSH